MKVKIKYECSPQSAPEDEVVRITVPGIDSRVHFADILTFLPFISYRRENVYLIYDNMFIL